MVTSQPKPVTIQRNTTDFFAELVKAARTAFGHEAHEMKASFSLASAANIAVKLSNHVMSDNCKSTILFL